MSSSRRLTPARPGKVASLAALPAAVDGRLPVPDFVRPAMGRHISPIHQRLIDKGKPGGGAKQRRRRGRGRRKRGPGGAAGSAGGHHHLARSLSPPKGRSAYAVPQLPPPQQRLMRSVSPMVVPPLQHRPLPPVMELPATALEEAKEGKGGEAKTKAKDDLGISTLHASRRQQRRLDAAPAQLLDHTRQGIRR